MTEQNLPSTAENDIKLKASQEKIMYAGSSQAADEKYMPSPFLGRAAFWRPRHMLQAPILHSLPIIFWVMEVLKPERYVQIGLGDGLVYLALCQAAERMNLATTGICLAADPEPITIEITKEHDAVYSGFSRLLDGDLSSVLERTDGAVDLLVINQPMDRDQLETLKKLWVPLLSERAVVIICGPERVFVDPETRRSWLSEEHPGVLTGFADREDQEIEILLLGTQTSEELARLATQRSEYLMAKQVFSRLGKGLESEKMVEALKREYDATIHRLSEAETSLEAQRQRAKVAERALEEIESAEKLQAELYANLQADLYEQDRALARKEAEIDSLKADMQAFEKAFEEEKKAHAAQVEDYSILQQKLESETRDLRVRAELLESEKRGIKKKLDELQVAYEERIDDIAVLVRNFQEKENALSERNASEPSLKITSLESDLANEKSQLERDLEITRMHRDELLRSTSWRITRPIRAIKMTFQRPWRGR